MHTIVLTTEGEAYTFGNNDEGALGREGRENIPLKVNLEEPVHMASAGDNHSVFANSRTGSIFFTGSYKYMRG
jgi:alpha-tubulin suppressor-like RCC1 family protein